VDSPPLSVAVDPLALAVWTRSLLVVLRTGATNRAMAGLKMESVARLPIRLLGAVLNDVPPHGLYRYYSYLPYGEIPDESDAWGQRPADATPAGQT
jgi:Mrp family chromosome partitioning ATPase